MPHLPTFSWENNIKVGVYVFEISEKPVNVTKIMAFCPFEMAVQALPLVLIFKY